MTNQHAAIASRTRAAYLRYIAAGVIALVGVFLAWRAIGPVGAPAPPAAGAPTPIPESAIPLPASLRDEITPASRAEITAALSRAYSNQRASLPATIRDLDTAFDHAARVASIYLTADLDSFAAYLADTGAQSAINAEDPDLRERTRQRWRSMSAPIALGAASLADSIARFRYDRGAEVEQPWIGYQSHIDAPSRYGLPADPAAGKLTIIEFIVPVAYEFESSRGPVWWGLWLAQRPGSSDWRIYRSVIYDSLGINAGVAPGF